MDECFEQCPRERHTVQYETSVTTNAINVNYFGYEERAIVISSYYARLSYAELSEIPKSTIFDFVSIIGGK